MNWSPMKVETQGLIPPVPRATMHSAMQANTGGLAVDPGIALTDRRIAPLKIKEGSKLEKNYTNISRIIFFYSIFLPKT